MKTERNGQHQQKEDIKESPHRRHLERARATSNYFTFFRLYTKIMKKLEALFLQDIINISSLDKIIHRTFDNKEYFMCTEEFLSNSSIGWSKKEQRNHLQTFRSKGYISITKKGIPACRWIRINLEKIELALDKALKIHSPQKEDSNLSPKGLGQSSPKGLDYPSPEGPVKKKQWEEREKKKKLSAGFAGQTKREMLVSPVNQHCHSHNGIPRINGFGTAPVHTKDYKLTKYLFRVLKARDKIRRKPAFSNWSKAFREALEFSSYNHLKGIITDYGEHLHEEFAPEAYSGNTFVDKLPQIESFLRKIREGKQVNDVW